MESTKFKSMDEYIKSFPVDIQKRLEQMRSVIKKAAPDATETISYNMPTLKLNGKNLAYFAANKNHMGFYPFPSGVKKFQELASDYVTTKGGVQLPYSQDLPEDLVTEVIKYRIEEVKKATKKSY